MRVAPRQPSSDRSPSTTIGPGARRMVMGSPASAAWASTRAAGVRTARAAIAQINAARATIGEARRRTAREGSSPQGGAGVVFCTMGGRHGALNCTKPIEGVQMAETRQLVIVQRNQFPKFALLAQAFADEPSVRLIWDRRLSAQRRECAPSNSKERRRRERPCDRSKAWGDNDHL